jgi:hypothetical protein
MVGGMKIAGFVAALWLLLASSSAPTHNATPEQGSQQQPAAHPPQQGVPQAPRSQAAPQQPQTRPPANRPEEHVRRALGQAAHEVGIPLRAERNVDPQAISLAHQLLLEIAAHTVEHLELVGDARNILGAGELLQLRNDLLVVRSQPWKTPLFIRVRASFR